MKKKIVAVSLLFTLLLTGCGTQDAVTQEAKKAAKDAGFIGYYKDINNASEEMEWKLVPAAISTARQQQLKKLYDVLEETVEKKGGKLIVTPSKDELLSWMDFQDFDEIEDVAGFGIDIDYAAENQEATPYLLEQLEKLGYEDIGFPPGEYSGICDFVRQGFIIRIVDYNYRSGDGYDSEEQDMGGISISLSPYQFVYPPQYEKRMEAVFEDGFCIASLYAGGYMDVIQFVGSDNEPGNSYTKRGIWWIKDDKTVEVEICIVQNREKAEGAVFSVHEQQGMINLIADMTGDAAGAADFVKNFHIGDETEGTIGNRKWTLEKTDMLSGLLGNQPQYILRLQ
ncbi:MAG: hypothetical protein J1F02_02835 [Lachnospiraceae bacterium]|nr:hypothetical protein [Lachnospiraceae bacterium]